MKIEEVKGIPDYAEILDLINAEWPAEFGESTDREKIRHMQEHHNPATDTVKYLREGGEVVGFYRYSRWPRANPHSRSAHLLDIVVLPSQQGRGLGRELMTDLIRDAPAAPLTALIGPGNRRQR